VEQRVPQGYLLVRAMISGKRVVGLAHRLVWQNLHGDIPDGKTVNHQNGIKDDNRPENIELRTTAENMEHAHRSGLIDQRGEKNPAAKLSDREVVQIRLAYDQGSYTMEQLSERFGVRVQQISRIVRGQRRASELGPTADRDLRKTPERQTVTA
jgi:hypothetical protein